MALLALVAMSVTVGCKQKTAQSQEEAAPQDSIATVVADSVGIVEDTVTVTTAREFIMALRSNRTIVVKAKKPLNLTLSLDELIEEEGIIQWYKDGEPLEKPGIYYEPEYDGNLLVLQGLEKLTIVGDGKQGAELVVTPRYADVLFLNKCRYIVLENLTMGHTDTGNCTGDVVNCHNSEDISLTNCRLYGCGVNGLSLHTSSRVLAKDCKLYGCSNSGAEIYGCVDVTLDNCDVYDNATGVFVDDDSSQISLLRCRVKDNRGYALSTMTEVRTEKCVLEDNPNMEYAEVDSEYDEPESEYSNYAE